MSRKEASLNITKPDLTQAGHTEERTSLPTALTGRRRGQTSKNTKAPSSLHKRLTKQLAGIMAHLERHPSDLLSRKRVDTINDLLRKT